ncbi:MAG TPA: hypothetical protein VHZ78_08825 [Rhizomicrobium sp.]|jgi:hypothetical protein|nr:hypothetical protein [Rhizomicrobium sp.]
MTMKKRITKKKAGAPKAMLVKRDKTSPAIKAAGLSAMLRAGVTFRGVAFKKDTAVKAPAVGYAVGFDYIVTIVRGAPVAQLMETARIPANAIGGFHFAPGGNATGKAGGDGTPAINPHSIWDRNFRPACGDPRGMTLVNVPGKSRVWCDIYLLGKDHLENGTSRHGATIADGTDLPQNPAGGYFSRFDYAAACAVMNHHGKQLLGAEEFFAAAYGVTEKTAAQAEPKTTGLDALRTSQWGLMQATGNMWSWGTDGHPDMPRASFFGGSWLSDEGAGSRFAALASWPDYSSDYIGARGRSDHLQLA